MPKTKTQDVPQITLSDFDVETQEPTTEPQAVLQDAYSVTFYFVTADGIGGSANVRDVGGPNTVLKAEDLLIHLKDTFGIKPSPRDLPSDQGGWRSNPKSQSSAAGQAPTQAPPRQAPRQQAQGGPQCADCGNVIQGFTAKSGRVMSGQDMANIRSRDPKYGRPLCYDCAKAADAGF